MHDPLVVAWEIRRPWPRRSRDHDSVRLGRERVLPRWRARYRHDCDDGCARDHAANPFPWYRPGSWSPFWTVAGRGYYWPSMVTVWHREPGGRDSGEVCKHYRREQRPGGTWRSTVLRGWRWHVHHYKIQVGPLQELRRRLLTRCAWCGGKSRKGDAVNVSHQWNGPRGRWWQGTPGLYHHDCSCVEHAHRSCACDEPLVESGGGFGRCMLCDRHAAGVQSPSMLERRRLLASVPAGQRDPQVWARVAEIAKRDRVAA